MGRQRLGRATRRSSSRPCQRDRGPRCRASSVKWPARIAALTAGKPGSVGRGADETGGCGGRDALGMRRERRPGSGLAGAPAARQPDDRCRDRARPGARARLGSQRPAHRPAGAIAVTEAHRTVQRKRQRDPAAERVARNVPRRPVEIELVSANRRTAAAEPLRRRGMPSPRQRWRLPEPRQVHCDHVALAPPAGPGPGAQTWRSAPSG